MSANTEQGGMVDDLDGAADRLGDYLVREQSVYLSHKSLRSALQAALAQNAQVEAVGSEPCATVADAVRIADKCRSPDDEGVVWVPESCYLTMVGEIERLETLLYTDGNANIPTHAERARVPDAWVMVPREPTEVMRDAGMDAHFHAEKRASGEANLGHKGMFSRKNRAAHVYAAMLDAAPSHPDTTGATP